MLDASKYAVRAVQRAMQGEAKPMKIDIDLSQYIYTLNSSMIKSS